MRALARVAVAAVLFLAMNAAAASAYVYWSNAGPALTSSGTTVERANLDGLSGKTITGAASGPTGLAVAGGYLYWANSGAHSIGRAKLDGTQSNPTFVSGVNAVGLATDGTYLYYTDASRYAGRVKLDGTGLDPHCIDFGSATSPTGVALAGGYVYVGEYASINVTNATCSAGPAITGTIASVDSTYPPFALALAGGYVYFTATPSNHGVVGRVLASVGSTADETYITGLGFPTGLAIVDGYIYWADHNTDAIGRAPLANLAAAQPAFIPNAGTPFGLVVDSDIDPTATAVSCTPATVLPGATTTCRASVSDAASSAVPSGLVTFSGNATTPFLGGGSTSTCTLTPNPAGGGASCVVGAVPQAAGDAPITASYAGDLVHLASSATAHVCVGTSQQCGGSQVLPPPKQKGCIVPKVTGLSLGAARRAIVKAGCTVGKVRRPRQPRHRRLRPLIVAAQNPARSRHVALRTKVSLVLKERPPAHRHTRR